MFMPRQLQCGFSLTFCWVVLSSSSSLSPSSPSFVLAFFIMPTDGTLFLFLPLILRPVPFLSPPYKYFLLVRTLDNCFARTLNNCHFAVPWLKYFCWSFSHTAAVRILVDPFFGSWAKHAVLCLGSTIFSIFNNHSSSVVLGHLSSTRSKNPSGMCICTRGQTALCITSFNVSLLVTLANELRLAATVAMCECALQA